ncbi:hypothetical protein GCM10010422_13070 [Streptomyces graminearus]|uniref:Uncharacterized protein n=1 Tax=Streptomyces graminearus TaxID=284030 RepID=A0ABN3KXC0_9ACTN
MVSYDADGALVALRGETREGRTTARRSRIIDMGRLLRDRQRKTAEDGWNYPEWGRPPGISPAGGGGRCLARPQSGEHRTVAVAISLLMQN